MRQPDLSATDLALSAARLAPEAHGDLPGWYAAIDRLPDIPVTRIQADACITIEGSAKPDDQYALESALQAFHPWRKGPFSLFGVRIDTEWRSDWKWDRVAPHLDDLTGQQVLDVGCGNGYFGWRMLAAGASSVTGIDPTILFCMQHRAINHYLRDERHRVLALRLEELTPTPFDTVFSMGVIYHRRDPLEHVRQLAGCLRPGGQLILESLVIVAGSDLIAPSRYARMRNVSVVPSLETMTTWVSAAGLIDVRIVDVTPTTTAEQHSTPWMRFESLPEALDPDNPHRTVEGLPAPIRAVVVAHKPG